jgi:subtilisin family serine protease
MDKPVKRVLAKSFFAVAVFMFCAVFLSGTGRAAAEGAAKVASEDGYATLLSKVDSRGTVRIIVRVDTAFTPEPTMTEKGIREQRSAIAKAQERLLATLSARGRTPLAFHAYQFTPYVAMTVDAATLAALLSSPAVVTIEEDRALFPAATNYSLGLIGATTLHAQGKTGKGYTVAVIDTGVDKNHPYLSGSVVSEACYSTNDAVSKLSSLCPGQVDESTATDSALPYISGNCPSGQCSHGTHVAGIVAGRRGVAGSPGPGVAPEAQLVAIQVFSRSDDEDECRQQGGPPCVTSMNSDLKKSLERVYALKDTYKIAAVNMSLGGGKFVGYCDTNALKADIDNLRAAGIATVICTQNQSFCGAISFPACISTSVSVGATDKDDNVADYSNSATFMTLLAPGSNIVSSIPKEDGGGYKSYDGTSMATPQVAGSWAVMRQAKPDASLDDILAAFTTTGKLVNDMTKCPAVSKQRINVLEASKDMATLKVQRVGAGRVTSNPAGIDCGTKCTDTYHMGTKVTLYAVPEPGAIFDGWSGACSGSGPCEITLDKSYTVKAVFGGTHNHTVTVTRMPAWIDAGTVVSDPPGINCGTDCSASFAAQSVVTLTATPSEGFRFITWGGFFSPCSGSNPLCTFTVQKDSTIRATFRR